MAKWRKQIKRFILVICVIFSSGIQGCKAPIVQMPAATQTELAARETLYAKLFPTKTQAPPIATPIRLTNTLGNPISPTTTNTIHTATVTPFSPTASATPITIPEGMLSYRSQSGDTLEIIAAHYGVTLEELESSNSFPISTLLPVDTFFIIPDALEEETPYGQLALPDSEVIYAPGAKLFNLISYCEQAGGYLTQYTQLIDGKTYSGPEIVAMVALETSTNPHLLLAFLEFRSNWVLGNPPGAENDVYPIGYNSGSKGLYNELMITARLLAEGYYGWRTGTRLSLTTVDGFTFRIHPELNAGSAAIQRLFTSIYKRSYWSDALYGEEGFLQFHSNMLGDPWLRAEIVEPLLTPQVVQPELALPFLPGLRWSFTAGPHGAWQTGTPRAALDFAPVTGEPPCAVSVKWTTAAAPGLVTRSMRGTLALDLDGDGDEGTGWVLVYMHVAEEGRAEIGVQLLLDDLVGHPSCERGNATGTHVHFTRKYNGEWIATDGPLPMILDGWQAFSGEGVYDGTLVRGDQIVISSSYGKTGSSIYRDDR